VEKVTRTPYTGMAKNRLSIVTDCIALKPHCSKNKSPFRHGYGKTVFFRDYPYLYVISILTLYARRVAFGLELPPAHGGIVLTGGSNL
jgi:hypothetical protein